MALNYLRDAGLSKADRILSHDWVPEDNNNNIVSSASGV